MKIRKIKDPNAQVNYTTNTQRCMMLDTMNHLPVELYRQFAERIDTARATLVNAMLDDIEELYAPEERKFKATFNKFEPEPTSMEVMATSVEEALQKVDDILAERGVRYNNLTVGDAENG